MLIIGIDSATEESKIGLACGEYAGGCLNVETVRSRAEAKEPAEIISSWINDRSGPVLMAVDSPLGWPKALGESLTSHEAGSLIDVDANSLFRRETDRFLREWGHQPLDVGADRIARTELATLKLLHRVRQLTKEEIPLAWTPNSIRTVSAIEVYPAATLKAHKLTSTGYKHPHLRGILLEAAIRLTQTLHIRGIEPQTLKKADEFDAVVCLVAAIDFLEGRAVPPKDQALAEMEGWIWVMGKPTANG